jgi:hypothetical protein
VAARTAAASLEIALERQEASLEKASHKSPVTPAGNLFGICQGNNLSMHSRSNPGSCLYTLLAVILPLSACYAVEGQSRSFPHAVMVSPVLAAAVSGGMQVGGATDTDEDIGAQINAAILKLPAMPVHAVSKSTQHCGVVRLTTGKYVFSTTIVKPNCVTIDGSGSLLVYTGHAFAVVEAGMQANEYADVSGGIDDLWLQGPASLLGAGFGNTVGVLIGGDPSGNVVPSDYVAYAQLNIRLHIEGFRTGIMLGGFSSLNSEMGGQLSNNYQAIWAPMNTVGAGEQFDLYGVVINNNYQTAILNDLGYEIKQYGGSIDYTGGVPGQPFYSGNKFALSGVHVNYEGHGVHIEQESGPLINMAGEGNVLSLFGGTLYQSGKPETAQSFVQVTGRNNDVVLEGVNFQSEHPVTELVDWEAAGTAGLLTLRGATGNDARAIPVGGNTKAIGTWGVDQGGTRFGPNGVISESTPDGLMRGQSGLGVIAGGVSWTTGNEPPKSTTCVTGSLYSNLSGSAKTSWYVCEGGHWVGK